MYIYLTFLVSTDFQTLHSGVLPTVAVTSCRLNTRTEFVWRLLICFVSKLEKIQIVNYVETIVEWEQWTVADSDSE